MTHEVKKMHGTHHSTYFQTSPPHILYMNLEYEIISPLINVRVFADEAVIFWLAWISRVLRKKWDQHVGTLQSPKPEAIDNVLKTFQQNQQKKPLSERFPKATKKNSRKFTMFTVFMALFSRSLVWLKEQDLLPKKGEVFLLQWCQVKDGCTLTGGYNKDVEVSCFWFEKGAILFLQGFYII